VIKDVTLNDEATYLCFVNNSSGQKKVEIELTVKGTSTLFVYHLLFNLMIISFSSAFENIRFTQTNNRQTRRVG
jgi:hypothetical protein